MLVYQSKNLSGHHLRRLIKNPNNGIKNFNVRSCFILGIKYESIKSACENLKITRNLICNRLKNVNNNHYQYIDKKNKIC